MFRNAGKESLVSGVGDAPDGKIPAITSSMNNPHTSPTGSVAGGAVLRRMTTVEPDYGDQGTDFDGKNLFFFMLLCLSFTRKFYFHI